MLIMSEINYGAYIRQNYKYPPDAGEPMPGEEEKQVRLPTGFAYFAVIWILCLLYWNLQNTMSRF